MKLKMCVSSGTVSPVMTFSSRSHSTRYLSPHSAILLPTQLSPQRVNSPLYPRQTRRTAIPRLSPVGVKLGSTRTVVVEPQGSVLKTHEALTCLARYEDVLTGTDQVIYGEQPAREYPERVEFMLRSGLPEDDERTETATTFFTYFIQANDVQRTASSSTRSRRSTTNVAGELDERDRSKSHRRAVHSELSRIALWGDSGG
jgi:hypothetical protein